MSSTDNEGRPKTRKNKIQSKIPKSAKCERNLSAAANNKREKESGESEAMAQSQGPKRKRHTEGGPDCKLQSGYVIRRPKS